MKGSQWEDLGCGLQRSLEKLLFSEKDDPRQGTPEAVAAHRSNRKRRGGGGNYIFTDGKKPREA